MKDPDFCNYVFKIWYKSHCFLFLFFFEEMVLDHFLEDPRLFKNDPGKGDSRIQP